ncbi:MAG: galactokinase family protein, partial [Planctomycetota bacterium]
MTSSVLSRVALVKQEFRTRFGTEPLVAARAPGRVELMGSHTDYNEGMVLTLPIDLDTWIVASARMDSLVRL